MHCAQNCWELQQSQLFSGVPAFPPPQGGFLVFDKGKRCDVGFSWGFCYRSLRLTLFFGKVLGRELRFTSNFTSGGADKFFARDSLCAFKSSIRLGFFLEGFLWNELWHVFRGFGWVVFALTCLFFLLFSPPPPFLGAGPGPFSSSSSPCPVRAFSFLRCFSSLSLSCMQGGQLEVPEKLSQGTLVYASQASTAMLLIDPSMSALHIIATQTPQSVGLSMNTNCERMAYRSFRVRGVQLEVSELLPQGSLACGSQTLIATFRCDPSMSALPVIETLTSQSVGLFTR